MAIQPETLARLPQAPELSNALDSFPQEIVKRVSQSIPPAECECGGMLFTLESGDTYCLNCGEL